MINCHRGKSLVANLKRQFQRIKLCYTYGAVHSTEKCYIPFFATKTCIVVIYYETMPIQIYWKCYHQKMKNLR